MLRVEQNRAPLIRHVFDEDADNVTVRVLASDGTELVQTTAAVTAVSTTEYTYQLAPELTAALDTLAVTWTATVDGVTQTFRDDVEVVGGVYFSLAELKAIRLGGAKTVGTDHSNAELLEMRSTVEDAIEDACGAAFVPRYTVDTVSTASGTPIRLRPYVRAIRSITVSALGVSTPLTTNDLALMSVSASGFVTGYSWGTGTATVGYEYGLDRPPERLRKAALLLAKVWLVSGPVDDRVTTMSSPDTGITATLATPGRGGSIFGVPEVDAAVMQNQLVVIA